MGTFRLDDLVDLVLVMSVDTAVTDSDHTHPPKICSGGCHGKLTDTLPHFHTALFDSLGSPPHSK